MRPKKEKNKKSTTTNGVVIGTENMISEGGPVPAENGKKTPPPHTKK